MVGDVGEGGREGVGGAGVGGRRVVAVQARVGQTRVVTVRWRAARSQE